MNQERGRSDEAGFDQWEAGALHAAFALPMIIGNLFQQFYNMADSVIVGNLVGRTRWRP